MDVNEKSLTEKEQIELVIQDLYSLTNEALSCCLLSDALMRTLITSNALEYEKSLLIKTLVSSATIKIFILYDNDPKAASLHYLQSSPRAHSDSCAHFRNKINEKEYKRSLKEVVTPLRHQRFAHLDKAIVWSKKPWGVLIPNLTDLIIIARDFIEEYAKEYGYNLPVFVYPKLDNITHIYQREEDKQNENDLIKYYQKFHILERDKEKENAKC